VLGARALVAFTTSGERAPVESAPTADPVARIHARPRGGLGHGADLGVETVTVPMPVGSEDMVSQVNTAMLRLGRGAVGDLVVIIGGSPIGTPGTTNFLRVHRLSGP